MTNNEIASVSRRTFVQTTAAATAAMMFNGGASVAGSDVIRVGVIGCGGRGTGAAMDCMRSSDGVEIVALGDLLPDRLAECRANLAKETASNAALAAKYKVTDERAFTGFDAYQKVLAADIHYVILATPPGFRPAHLAAAVAAGKHIFSEKPVAVDSAGIRSVLATYELAKQKSLGIGVGTQRRHQAEYVPTIKRIHDGAIGDVLSGQVYWNQGGLWNHARQDAWTDVEWQIRNWLVLHLALRRPHRRAARPQHRRRELGAQRASDQGHRRRRAPVADRSEGTATSTITSRSTSSIRAARAS